MDLFHVVDGFDICWFLVVDKYGKEWMTFVVSVSDCAKSVVEMLLIVRFVNVRLFRPVSSLKVSRESL